METYIVSIARQQLEQQIKEKGSATTACFECGSARKRLTIDAHFKVVAFCRFVVCLMFRQIQLNILACVVASCSGGKILHDVKFGLEHDASSTLIPFI